MSEVVNLSEHKAKQSNLFSLELASADVAYYEKVVKRSVENFHTFSVQQKQELYESLAEFNISIVNNLLERMKNEHQ